MAMPSSTTTSPSGTCRPNAPPGSSTYGGSSGTWPSGINRIVATAPGAPSSRRTADNRAFTGVPADCTHRCRLRPAPELCGVPPIRPGTVTPTPPIVTSARKPGDSVTVTGRPGSSCREANPGSVCADFTSAAATPAPAGQASDWMASIRRLMSPGNATEDDQPSTAS